jgi:hypothetical protein
MERLEWLQVPAERLRGVAGLKLGLLALLAAEGLQEVGEQKPGLWALC